jgi:putative transposase
VRGKKNRKKLVLLRLSKLGVFKVIIHRDFPLNKVRRLHKELSRKRYLSKNWFKAGIKLARAYEHLKNLRRDIYMELGKWFAEHYDVVVMEDIEVRQLIGKSERILRRGLYDVAFHELKEILRHQLENYGKTLRLPIQP